MKRAMLLLATALLWPAASGDVWGWTIQEKESRLYRAKDLYGHIDGGAELFLELGFEEVLVEFYFDGKSEISVETYRMESPRAALAVYLSKKGKETPLPGVRSRNTGNRYQITLLKGRCFVIVNNPDGVEDSSITTLVNARLDAVPDEAAGDLFSVLPAENRIDGSELLLRGPVSLQSLITLGDGDILGLGGRIFAPAADYGDMDGSTFTRIVVPYSDATEARRTLDRLKACLDPTLSVTSRSPGGFAFKDYQGRFGSVLLQGSTLTIELNRARP